PRHRWSFQLCRPRRPCRSRRFHRRHRTRRARWRPRLAAPSSACAIGRYPSAFPFFSGCPNPRRATLPRACLPGWLVSEICIEVADCWKVFGGRDPDKAIEMAESGATRAEILERTGATVAVRNVAFTVNRGETFVVMGLSGSGKSTLVRCVARLSDPTRGKILLDGEDLTAMDEATLRRVRRQKLSMVFQHFGLFPHRRVIDNVAYGLEVQGVPKAERRERAEEILAVVGLESWGNHFPQQLSGGMQQRVGLARALAVDP